MSKKKRKEREEERLAREAALASKWIALNPSLYFEREAGGADVKKAALRIYLAGVVHSLYYALPAIYLSLAGGLHQEAVSALLTSFFALFATPLIHIAVSLGVGGIAFLCAKAFGGTGNFTTQFYLPSLYALPLAVLNVLLQALALIQRSPDAFAFYGLFLAFLYGLLYYFAVRQAHALGFWRALATVAATSIVSFIAASALFAFIAPAVMPV